VRDCQEILRARFLDHKIIDPTILWPSTQTRRVQLFFVMLICLSRCEMVSMKEISKSAARV